MKSAFIFSLILALFSVTVSAQNLENLDRISPFHDGLAAVEKDGQWGFIDTQGNMVIDFRGDLVVAGLCPKKCGKEHTIDYPRFHNGRALVKVVKDGITLYGYLDKSGNMAIEPEFINATNFIEQGAIVLKLYKEKIGQDVALSKNMIVYSYNEEVIDTSGKVIKHLRGPINITYSAGNLKTPPEINSKFISENLMATQVDKQWKLLSLN